MIFFYTTKEVYREILDFGRNAITVLQGQKDQCFPKLEWLFLFHNVLSLLQLLMVVPDFKNTFRVHTVFVIVFGKIILQLF